MRMWLIAVLALLALVHGSHVVLLPEASQKPQEMSHADTGALLSCWRDIVIPVSLGHSAKRKAATSPPPEVVQQTKYPAALVRITREKEIGGLDRGRGAGQNKTPRWSSATLGRQDCPQIRGWHRGPTGTLGPTPTKGLLQQPLASQGLRP